MNMNEKTKNFILNKFRTYYNQTSINLPPEYEKREWGFIPFTDNNNTFMKRHIAFGSYGEVLDYLNGIIPAHVYYSVAYYEYPSASKMNEKNWLKADLIFDIDSDHLPGKIDSYAQMLENGKKETFKLIDFLLNDFGFDEQYVHIVFSGGRGYHCHITDPSVSYLDSSQRREIVDYVSGKSINIDKILNKKEVIGDAGIESAYRWMLPAENCGGWKGRINKIFVNYLKDIATQENSVKLLTGFKGIGKKTAQQIVEIFRDEHQVEVLRTGNIDVLSGVNKNIINLLIQEGIKKMSVVIDEPVTADIKRLIRLPGSLHGTSSMKVISLEKNELEYFEPLNDAVVFGENSVKLKVTEPFKMQMKGKDFDLEVGEQQLPEYVAMHLMCRGVAEYG